MCASRRIKFDFRNVYHLFIFLLRPSEEAHEKKNQQHKASISTILIIQTFYKRNAKICIFLFSFFPLQCAVAMMKMAYKQMQMTVV